jgi:hypothetical protein
MVNKERRHSVLGYSRCEGIDFSFGCVPHAQTLYLLRPCGILQESKAELTLEGSRVVGIRIAPVSGRAMLTGRPLEDFTVLVNARAQEIADKWNAYFVGNKHIEPQAITRRIKQQVTARRGA